MDAALADFQKALALDQEGHDADGEVSVLGNLGTYYLTLGQTDRAKSVLQQAVEKSRDFPQGRQHRYSAIWAQ